MLELLAYLWASVNPHGTQTSAIHYARILCVGNKSAPVSSGRLLWRWCPRRLRRASGLLEIVLVDAHAHNDARLRPHVTVPTELRAARRERATSDAAWSFRADPGTLAETVRLGFSSKRVTTTSLPPPAGCVRATGEKPTSALHCNAIANAAHPALQAPRQRRRVAAARSPRLPQTCAPAGP
jgi:hypothetical protein